MMRPITLFALWLSLTAAHAQAMPKYHYMARLSEMTDPMHAKLASEAMVELDLDGIFQCDPTTQWLDLIIGDPINEVQLALHLDPYGFTVTAFQAIDGTAIAGFPVIGHTGNNERDEAGYQAAKLAWITAHPQEYEHMTAPAAANE